SRRSSVVLPAPDGPMMATRSPCATCRSSPHSAIWPQAWVWPTPASFSAGSGCAARPGAGGVCNVLIADAYVPSLEQAGGARGFFDSGVVLRLGLDKATSSLQIKNRLVLRVGRIEGEEGSLDLLDQ